MANSTIYPYGTGGSLPTGYPIINDLTTGGADKAFSAEMGKYIGERTIINAGTFGDAYEKTRSLNVPFPWLLRDTDDYGNNIKKMMWHIGDGKFIDAIGGEVEGDRNGLTVVSTQPCIMRIYSQANDPRYLTSYNDYTLRAGVNNFPLSQVDAPAGQKRKVAIRFYDNDGTTQLRNVVTKIDFGGMAFSSPSNTNLLEGESELVTIKRLRIVFDPQSVGTTWSVGPSILNNCTKLAYLDLSGSITFNGGAETNAYNFLGGENQLLSVDLSRLKITSTRLNRFMYASGWTSLPVQYLDISGIDFGACSMMKSAFRSLEFLTTIVVGNFSNAQLTTANFDSTFYIRTTGRVNTLVCVMKYPPTMVTGNADMLGQLARYNSNTFGTSKGHILVPPGSRADYIAANGWSDYASIIEEFNEGDYTVIDNTPT